MPSRPPARISTFAPLLQSEVLGFLRSGLPAAGVLLVLPAGWCITKVGMYSDDLAPGLTLAGPILLTGSSLAMQVGLWMVLVGGSPGAFREKLEFYRLAGRPDSSILPWLLLARLVFYTLFFLPLLPVLFFLVALGGVSPGFMAIGGFLVYGAGLYGLAMFWPLHGVVARGRQAVWNGLGYLLLVMLPTAALLVFHLLEWSKVFRPPYTFAPQHLPLVVAAICLALVWAVAGFRSYPEPAEGQAPAHAGKPGPRQTEDTFMSVKDRAWPRWCSVVGAPGLVLVGIQREWSPGVAALVAFAGVILAGGLAAYRGFYREQVEQTWDALLMLPTPPAVLVFQKIQFFLEHAWVWAGAGAVVTAWRVLSRGDPIDWGFVWVFQLVPALWLQWIGFHWARNWGYGLMRGVVQEPDRAFARTLAGRVPGLIGLGTVLVILHQISSGFGVIVLLLVLFLLGWSQLRERCGLSTFNALHQLIQVMERRAGLRSGPG